MAADVFATPENTVDPLATLVGEGKKFKTAEDLAKGKIEADAYIEQLKSELSGLRAELAKTPDPKTADDQLAAVREEIKALRTASAERSKEATPPGLTVDGIRSLVAETITTAERNRTAQQNILTANDAMVAHFGSIEKAFEAVQAKSKELGLPVDDLRSMAAKSPSAFQKIMLGDGKVSNDGPLTPRVVNAQDTSNAQRQAAPGTKEFFENIRKTDRNRYWTPAVQMALHKAVQAGTYQL